MACHFYESFSRYCHFWIVNESETNGTNCFLGHLGSVYDPYKTSTPILPTNLTIHLRSKLHKFEDFTNVVLEVYDLKKDRSRSYNRRNYDYGSCPGAGVQIANTTDWKGHFSLDNTVWQCSFVIIRIVDGKLRLKIPNFIVRLQLHNFLPICTMYTILFKERKIS